MDLADIAEAVVGPGELIDPDSFCLAWCDGKDCGPDGCGGSCGGCGQTSECSPEGTCVPVLCLSTKDCPGILVCDKESGECVECTIDEDCRDGALCGADHECHPDVPCQSDKDCKNLGMVCDPAAGRCVECLTSADCLAEQFCGSSLCLPDLCQSGESVCQDDVVHVCSPDGCCLELQEVCREGQFCEAGACLDLACIPSAKWCESNVAVVCASDGRSIAHEVDCAAGSQHCFDGECLDGLCVPQQKFCLDDVTAATCLEDGLAYSTLACGEGTVCELGECLALICEPASAWCEEGMAAKCNDLGTGAATQTDCKSLGGKVCVDGECVPCAQDCAGKDCGPDGCGGSCGECSPGQVCVAGKCPAPGDECDDGNDVPWDGCTDGKLSEFVLTDGTSRPFAASLSDDRFVLVQRKPNAGKNDLVAKVFDKDVNLLTGPLMVAQGLGTTAQLLGLGALPDGGFVVMWTSGWEGAGQGLRLQRFLANGEPSGPEEVVVGKKETIASRPSAAALADGRFVVIWSGWWPDSQPNAGPQAVFGRLYLPDGTASESFVVQSGSASFTSAVVAAVPDSGRFGVVFEVEEAGTVVGVSGRFVDSEGIPAPSSFPVTACDSCWPSNPEALGLTGGELLVAWTEKSPQSQEELRARRIDSEGQFSGAVLALNSISEGSQQGANLASWADAGAVAVWSNKPLYSGWEVRARCFDASQSPLSGDVQANTTTGSDIAPTTPVTFSDGTALLIWHDNGIGISGRRISKKCKLMYK